MPIIIWDALLKASQSKSHQEKELDGTKHSTNGHNFWEDLDVDVDSLELHEVFPRFLGTQTMPDGSLADCRIDMQLGAVNGMLTARIITLDIQGTLLSDKVVVINQDLKAYLSLEGFIPHAAILFNEVDVLEDALRIKVQVNIQL